MTKIVQRFIRHATRHGSVTNDRNNVTELIHSRIARNGKTMCIRQHSGGVAVLNEVVAAFFAAGVTRDAAVLAQLGEPRLTTRENLVHIRLVAGVPQHGIGGGLEYSVQRNGQFHGTQVGPQVTTGLCHGVHDEIANLTRQLIELGNGQRAQIRRLVNAVEKRHMHIRLRSRSYEGLI